MKKLLFSILLTMASAMAMNVSAGTRTIYLDANMWNTDGAIFAVHVWHTDDTDAADYTLTLVEGNIYKAEIRDDATSAIFLRRNPASTSDNVWDDVWNRSETTIPSDKNQYTITAWSAEGCTENCLSIGEWSVYGVTPEPEPVGTRTIYLDANIWNTGGAIFAVHVWNASDAENKNAGYQLTHVEGSIYTAEIREDATNAIFVRKDPNAENATANVWNGEWNRSETTIPSDKNQYTITAWSAEGCTENCLSIGEWSVYGVTPEPEPVGTRTIYLDANMWNTDGAIFAVHVWNASDAENKNAGYQLTHVEGSIYTAEIRDDATNAIFVRKDPNAADATANVWNGEWNRSETTIPSDKNQYTITAWSAEGCTENCLSIGEWSVYGVTPEPEPVGTRTIYLDANMWNTDGAIFAVHVWKNESDATDYNLTHIEGSIYEVEIRDDAPYAIFLRKDPNNVDVNNVWVGEWNRSVTTIPNDKDQYRITAWKVDENCTPDETTTCPSAGEWSMYIPNQPSTETVYERDVRVGYYGTICLPFSSNNITGVTLYSIAGQTEDGNGLYLDSESELQAGVPYFFLANSTKLVVTATGESTFTPHADHWYPSGNGLVGYINDGHEEYIPQNLYHYMLKDNGLYQVNSIAIVRSKYAYVNWSDIPTTTAELAPGRQRRVIGAQHTTTGVDNIEQTITPTKILRDGQLLIIRDGQLFTITGQMVK